MKTIITCIASALVAGAVLTGVAGATTIYDSEATFTHVEINPDGAWVEADFPANSGTDGKWVVETYDPTDFYHQILTYQVIVDTSDGPVHFDQTLPIKAYDCAQVDVYPQGSENVEAADIRDSGCQEAAPVTTEAPTTTVPAPTTTAALTTTAPVAVEAAMVTAPPATVAPDTVAPVAQDDSSVAVTRPTATMAYTGLNPWTAAIGVTALTLGGLLLLLGPRRATS